jgi:hypothetical protein
MVLSQLSGVEEEGNIKLVQGFDNYPNPTDVRTTIRYELGRTCPVSVNIHDASGRRVAELVAGQQVAGNHSVVWNAEDMPAGVYYCTLQTGDRMQTRPLVVNH